MGIESLKSVYDPISKEKELKAISTAKDMGFISPSAAVDRQISAMRALSSWKDSASVVRLSSYLKDNKDRGIRLIVVDGHPVLRFEPGLTKIRTEDDKVCWLIASNCLELLREALTDLKYLIGADLINIPELSGR